MKRTEILGEDIYSPIFLIVCGTNIRICPLTLNIVRKSYTHIRFQIMINIFYIRPPLSITNMKYYLILTVFLFLSIFSENSFAQNDYEPGFIVKNNNDTIPLLIRRDDEISLRNELNYQLGDKQGVYTPGEIGGFGFKKDAYSFETTMVNLKASKDSLKTLMFAKIMMKGAVSLYKVLLPRDLLEQVYIKNNYAYILKKQQSYYSLWQRELTFDRVLDEDKRYVGILRLAFQDCQAIPADEYDKLILQDKPLIKLIQKYNNCVYPDKQVQVFNHTVKPIFKHGLDLGYESIKILRDNDSGHKDSYSSKTIGYFLEVIKPNLSTRSSIKLGITFSDYSYSSDSRSYNVRLVKFPLLLQRYFGNYNSSSLPFVNLGITVITTKSKIEINESPFYIPEEEAEIIPFTTLGLGMYLKNFKLDARFQTFQFKNNISSISVGYRLDKIFNKKQP